MRRNGKTRPIAVSDRQVAAKPRLWQHTVTLLAAADSPRAKEWQRGPGQLPAGRYLVKVHVDRSDRTLSDWRATLRNEDFVGQAEFQANWRSGYGAMTTVDAEKLKK